MARSHENGENDLTGDESASEDKRVFVEVDLRHDRSWKSISSQDLCCQDICE